MRAIGVSNFMPDHLATLRERTSVVPAVNQIEVHPYFSQSDVRKANADLGVLTQTWSLIGGITSHYGDGAKTTFNVPVILSIAEARGKSAAQVMLPWQLQLGHPVIPKSVRPERITENFDVFDFELALEQPAALKVLNTGVRGGPDPDSITLKAYGRDIPER